MPAFLELPIEVRLQIYSSIVEIHPISNPHLACFENQPIRQDCMVALGQSTPKSMVIQRQRSAEKAIGICILTPTSQPQTLQNDYCGKIPTAFLTSCKQIYLECQSLPWEMNQFAFINWFWSGIYAARQFSRSLAPWQLDSVRYVGVEALTRDLRAGDVTQVYGESSQEVEFSRSEWEELCSLWQGVWGMRLAIKGSSKNRCMVNSDNGVLFRPEERAYTGMLAQFEKVVEDKGVLNVDASWIRTGLCEMKSLKWLEIEIEDESVTKEEKLSFCAELASVLGREMGAEVKVIVVEMVEPAPIPNKDFKWFGGPPGDDSIDGS